MKKVAVLLAIVAVALLLTISFKAQAQQPGPAIPDANPRTFLPMLFSETVNLSAAEISETCNAQPEWKPLVAGPHYDTGQVKVWSVAASPAVEAPRLDRRAMDGLFARMSPAERRRHYEASRDYRTHIEFDNDTRLSPDERGALLALLASHAASRPMPGAMRGPVPRATAAPTRGLTQIEVARLRRGLLATLPNAAASETLREVVWAVEEGTLSRFAPAHAVNIALKLVRDGAWTRPNRMPPNWQRALARPETCTAA